MQRLIDANELLKDKVSNAYISRFEIENAPTIDAEPVVYAHWFTERSISPFPICSNCNTVNACHSPYCGGCGAKMDKEAEQE